jgi:hypothetical protein
MKERVRELADVPDKLAIYAGSVGLVLAAFYPPALGPALFLLTTGFVGLKVTEAVWPKKQRTA